MLKQARDFVTFSQYPNFNKPKWPATKVFISLNKGKMRTNNHLFCVLWILFLVTISFIYSEKATKCWEIFTLLLSYVVPVKSKVKISQNFEAFSEYMNFTYSCFSVQNSAHFGPHFLCWFSGVNTLLISSWEEFFVTSWGIDKMTTIFTQIDNFDNFAWIRCHFVHLVSL